MTTDQEAEDIAASVRHRMEQRGRAAREWERQSKQWELRWRDVTGERDAARAQLEDTQRQLSDLLALIGTETPIAAFDLATTWRTEKAGYMEEVGALEPRVATLRAALSALLVGAEQQSQSHADVAALCRTALGEDRL